MTSINFTLSDKTEIKLETAKGVFHPTETSNILINAVIQNIKDNSQKILDLGCGTGIVGIALFKKKLLKKIYASDLSKNTTDITIKNLEMYGLDHEVKNGSLLEPWKNQTFDVIIDDISGISSTIASISSWFKDVPCQSGIDGTDLTIEIIKNSKKHLNKDGKLFFPVISLSNEKKIIEEALNNYSNVEEVMIKEWPMPQDLLDNIDIIKSLRDKGHISYVEKFGIILCNTKIYIAKE